MSQRALPDEFERSTAYPACHVKILRTSAYADSERVLELASKKHEN